MKASALAKTLISLTQQKIPTFLWGAPGVGKSSIVKQVAKKQGIGFIDLRLSLMDPTDLKGIPFFEKEDKSAIWASPSFLPKEGEGILFLDELNSAAPSVQASAYQLILDRKVAEYTLPDGWSIVAAGNREGDRGVTYRMPLPLANRFVHFELEVDANEWKKWAYRNGIDERIIGYIGYRSEHLFSFDPKSDAKSFATPRSWEYVHKLLQSGIEDEELLESISGAIGEKIALEFLQFSLVHKELPDVKAILEAKEATYPKEMTVLYLLSSALVSALLQNNTKERLENLLGYLLGLEAEFSVMVVQELQKNGITMQNSANFTKWIEKFSHLLG